jgi:abortive infection bacteriophage resistance protein
VNQDKKTFQKPATTYQQQLARLKERGMLIPYEQTALRALAQLNYYRLSAYWRAFEVDSAKHQFKPNTHFTEVVNLYNFDKQLRLQILSAIERVEVSVRAKWAYVLAHHHGVHAHLEPTITKEFWSWHANSEKLKEALIVAKKEPFIQHFKVAYEEPTPPIWVICEVMTLGLLSKYYDNLKPKETRRAIAHTYGLDDDCLASWLQHLTVIRNICAHHARLWNRELVKTPQQIKTKPMVLAGQFAPNRKIYNTLLILLYFTDVIDLEPHWRTELLALLNQHPTLLPRMGFPIDWANKPIWSEKTYEP